MINMIEIRIHGRGGQGSVTMANFLAEAGFFSGFEVQAFPNFGVERRGAPVTAYIRLDKKFIRLRSQIYSPDYLIVQDASLLKDGKILGDLKKGSIVLINSAKEITDLKIPQGVRIKFIDATEIALKIIGKPIINTVLLGAFAGMTGLIKLSSIEKVIKEKFETEIAGKNIEAVKEGYKVISHN